MTIKEFAQLCGCNAQTLRYYDKIDLLKPIKVDPWSGYRYYTPEQALDFVKIKNLQAADFSIQEIKALLPQPDQLVYEAFEAKIREQTQKLERIREIQQTYLAEKNTMEQIIYSMTDFLLSRCGHPEILTEFGMTVEDAPAILSLLKEYWGRMLRQNIPAENVSMTVNDELVQGQEAVLERIHSLTRENTNDTILLNSSASPSMEFSHEPAPDFFTWDKVWEQQDWEHVSEFIDRIPTLEKGKEYGIRITKKGANDPEDLSFHLFLLGTILYKQKIADIVVNCSSTVDESAENHFTLFRRKNS